MRSADRFVEDLGVVEVFDGDVSLRVGDAKLPAIYITLTRFRLNDLPVKLEASPHSSYPIIAALGRSRPSSDVLRFRLNPMSSPARFLLGTIIVGILVLFICGLALRRPAASDPFDQPAPASNVR